MKKILFFISLFFSISFYSQNDTISVVKTSNVSIAFAEKMNIVYRGLLNPISISVPNCKSFEANGNGLTKISEGKYTLSPGQGLEAIVTVDILLYNGSTKKENHRFKILNLQPLDFVIDDVQYSICNECLLEFSKLKLKNAKISLTGSKLLPYEINFNIAGFWLNFPNEEVIRNDGDFINDETFSELLKLKSGTVVTIKVSLSNNVGCIFVPPLKIMVVD